MPRIVTLDEPGTELTVYGGTDHDGYSILGTICFPIRDHMNAATATAMFNTNWSFLAPDERIDHFLIQGNLLTLQRNEAVQRMKGDWLFFIDDDMVWQPEAIGKLIAARNEIDADIIGGLCFRRSPPHQPTLYMREQPTEGLYNYLDRWDSDIVEVDATGMAFVLIHKRVFEAIAGSPMPSLEERKELGLPQFFRWQGTLGEDLRFCQDAKAAGCRIFVDTRIEIGHVSEIEVRYRHFLIESLSMSGAQRAERKMANDRMGLPTLTPNEIKDRLGW